MKTNATTRAFAELFLGSSIWGFGFIATIWVLPSIGPVWMTSIRFFIAAVLLHCLFRPRYSLAEFKSLFWPGFFLFGVLTFQSWGLKYASATRCGFIAILYVLFIPFFERIFLKLKIRKILFFWISLALIGTALICGALTINGLAPDFLASFNLGDGLTLISAVCAAGHLIMVNQRLHVTDSPLKFHIYQCIWITIFAATTGTFFESFGWFHTLITTGWPLLTWVGLFHLSILSSAFAFLILVRAQRFLSPSTAGMLVLLESPWAMLFSVLIFSESLSALQFCGAGLILLAAVAESLSQTIVDRAPNSN